MDNGEALLVHGQYVKGEKYEIKWSILSERSSLVDDSLLYICQTHHKNSATSAPRIMLQTELMSFPMDAAESGQSANTKRGHLVGPRASNVTGSS